MPTVTRTLKKGTDTGRLNRAEVRAVTAAIQAGRTDDVVSGAVLQQFRAALKSKSPSFSALAKDLGIDVKTITVERSARAGEKAKAAANGLAKTSKSSGRAREKGSATARAKK